MIRRMLKSVIESFIITIFGKRKIKKLNGYIDSFKYISFDIFDTLIVRKVKKPEDIFEIVEEKAKIKNINGFKNRRIKAQREIKKKSHYEEITLEEIYNKLNDYYDYKELKKLKKLEIETEKKLCYANKEMLNFYNYCIKKGKIVFITSDMYLPYEVVEKILNQNGITCYKKLYLSSSERKTKKTGNLFKLIIKENNINPKDMIHIGDSPFNDFISPKKNKIQSLLIKR